MSSTDDTTDTPAKAKPAPAKAAARKFQLPKIRPRVALMALGVLAVAGAAAGGWYWWQLQKAPVPEVHAQKPVKPISAPPAPEPVAAAQEISRPASAPVASQPEHSAAPEERVREKVPPAPEREADAAPVHARSVAAKARRQHEKAATNDAPEHENMPPDAEPASAPAAIGSIDKQVRQFTVQQQADNEFRKASGLVQQGNVNDAMAGYEAALQLDPNHEAARQALVVLLLEKKRNADAERLLQDGLKLNIKNSGFATLLARIQMERDASWSALLTLQKTLPYAEQQADYQAFVAGLLQRLNRHKEAVAHYQRAVQLAPDFGVWLMGLGISLQALQRNEEAREAFQRAQDTHSLNTDLEVFVAQRLRELKRF